MSAYEDLMARAAAIRARNEAELAANCNTNEALAAVPSNPDDPQGVAAERGSATAATHGVATDATPEPVTELAAELAAELATELAAPIPTTGQDAAGAATKPDSGGPATEEMPPHADGKTPIILGRQKFSAKALAVLDRPLLLSGEDEKLHDDLVAAVRTTVEPSDFLEEIWLRDFIANQWDVMRHRRFITALITATEHEALEKLLGRLLSAGSFDIGSASEAETLAWRHTCGNEEAIAEVEELLESAGLTWDAVSALAAALKIDEIERFDRLIRISEKRRDDTLRQIDLHRKTLGSALRGAVEQIEDADFRELDEPGEEWKKAA